MSAAKRSYVVYASTLTAGWDVVCMDGANPLYVIDHCATEGEARKLADSYSGYATPPQADPALIKIYRPV